MDEPQLLDADGAPEDYEAMVFDDPPVFGEAIDWGRAVVDGKDLTFNLYYDEQALLVGLNPTLPAEPTDWNELSDMESFRRWTARRGLAVADATEGFVRTLSPDARARINIEWGGPTTAGPGLIDGQALAFLLGDDPIGRLADLIEIAFAAGWLAVKTGIADKSGKPVGISDGWAVVLATMAVEETFASRATDLVEVTPLFPHNPDRMGTPEGYAVQLRDDEWLYSVVISFHGDTLSTSRVELGRLSMRPKEPFEPEGVDDGQDAGSH